MDVGDQVVVLEFYGWFEWFDHMKPHIILSIYFNN